MAGGPVRLLLLPAAQAEAHIRRAAVPDHQRQGNGDNGQRKGHVGGGHPRDPHPLADKDLIHNVVQVVDHQGQGLWGIEYRRIRRPMGSVSRGFCFRWGCSIVPAPFFHGGADGQQKKHPDTPLVSGPPDAIPSSRSRQQGDGRPPATRLNLFLLPIQTNCWLRNFTESAHGSRALTASREYLVSEESISFALG